MQRVLWLAYDLNPTLGSECGLAQQWLRIVSRQVAVEVLVDAWHQQDILAADYPPQVTFHFIHANDHLRRFATRWGEYWLYQNYYRRAKQLIPRILAEKDIAFIHCVTPNGIHAHNDVYRFRRPVVIGPVTGGLPTPKHFGWVFRDRWLQVALRDFYYRRGLRTPAWRAYFNQSRKIIASTPEVKAMLPEKARDRCVTLFDVVVDADFYRPGPERAARTEPKILFAGLLESKKGAVLLLAAARQCLRRGVKNFSIQIAGTGPQRKRLEKLIRRYRLADRVTLLGQLSKTELLARYQDSDIFCLPTLREPGGNVILEAMACGLPVVTSDYGGPAYSVTADCGVKIPVTDTRTYIRDLSDALLDLLAHPERRRRLGSAARARAVAEYSSTALSEKILNLYAELLSAPRSA